MPTTYDGTMWRSTPEASSVTGDTGIGRVSETEAERRLRGLAGGIYIDASLPILHLAPAEKSACLAGADALRREREAAERKARHTELQQRIAGHLDVCIYCDSGLSNDCAVGRALLRDAHDFNKAMPTEPTR